MAIKKSDSYSPLWASCDELSESIDASHYKDYVLLMMFIKNIFDKYGNSDNFALHRYIDSSEPEESNSIIRPCTGLYKPLSYPVKAQTCNSAMPYKKRIITGFIVGEIPIHPGEF